MFFPQSTRLEFDASLNWGKNSGGGGSKYGVFHLGRYQVENTAMARHTLTPSVPKYDDYQCQVTLLVEQLRNVGNNEQEVGILQSVIQTSGGK
jgi:hypothetical protein